MKVSELIELLKQMSQDYVVVFHDIWNDNDVVLTNVQENNGRLELF